MIPTLALAASGSGRLGDDGDDASIGSTGILALIIAVPGHNVLLDGIIDPVLLEELAGLFADDRCIRVAEPTFTPESAKVGDRGDVCRVSPGHDKERAIFYSSDLFVVVV